ncbi:sporulation histidine kinase inhibitor Sda [Bacillus sp. DTU_2020_1000418_1_SI_GHA_SEK_038]|uniref:sporulation histidine kinase inhibitor Sda n=1 Tax=Bacillus sp. DTU_2020_1000418_1_SI_GHA_SEK_038 TaxID=3077585 RepID=UPI0028EF163E|nr:sporulation histidine kinase inhibitor Sda [Bacillus sp. DTU_2020_1000418_1_SI_GHA_SEK_038]WNS75100.1 sporulation histidine kinase inhibitor Sda [Bacillus sp. DTU_2020_1000418_1_SI_GHA_SEK_038]
MESLAYLTDTILINTYLKAIEQKLDPYFIQLLLAEIEERGLKVEDSRAIYF